ncbi:hypothetical protein [uncultured Psychroserpens sp.]|uniref:hypothetical protein n=1 Tax=uncultured Psychroserpens sp. TaxID=255436 RepID=UPI00262004E0|nr:hypothetical protein [uncultured Psychroserpens sp.]
MDRSFFKRVFWVIIAIALYFFINSDLGKALFSDYEDYKPFDLEIVQVLYIVIPLALLSAIVIFWVSTEKDLFIRIAKSFAYSIFIGLTLGVIIAAFDSAFVFQVNRLYTKKTVLKSYKIKYIRDVDDTFEVTLRTSNNKNGFTVFNKFTPEDESRLREKQVITIETGVGLFDRPFLFLGKLKTY